MNIWKKCNDKMGIRGENMKSSGYVWGKEDEKRQKHFHTFAGATQSLCIIYIFYNSTISNYLKL